MRKPVACALWEIVRGLLLWRRLAGGGGLGAGEDGVVAAGAGEQDGEADGGQHEDDRGVGGQLGEEGSLRRGGRRPSVNPDHRRLRRGRRILPCCRRTTPMRKRQTTT